MIETLRDLTINPHGVPIEDIKVGDMVYGYNQKGELILQPVVWAGQTGVKQTICLKWRGGFATRKRYLYLTPEHLVRRVNGEWVRADQLQPEDRVMAMSRGVYQQRASINHVIEAILPGRVCPVYDISLGDGEPCFIANEIAVHNSEPNMQNIMARGDQTKVAEVRRGYIARPGFTLTNSDLKTIEPVLLAWISGSRRMKDIFLLGVREPDNPYADYYRNLGAHFFKVADPLITPEKVTKEMRVVAKNDILLALQYGRSPHALSQVLGCTYEEADLLLKQFFYELYPEVHVAYEAVRHAVFYGQMVVTVTGTRQRFPLQQLYDYNRETDYWTLPYDLNRKLNVSGHDGHMLRKAWNFVHQGPAAQINNSGLVALHQARMDDLQLARDLCPISSVHDAIVAEVATYRLQEIVNRMTSILYNPQRLDDLGFNFGFTMEENPLRGEVKAGTNYYDMEEIAWQRV